MSKDRRTKGCPNETCERHNKQYKYKSTDKYCTICGETLILVCSRCHSEIADEGIDHKICARCEATIKDRNERIVKGAKDAGNLAVGVIGLVPVAAKNVKGVDPKNVKQVGKAVVNIAQNVVKK